jgi:hypothetical protein
MNGMNSKSKIDAEVRDAVGPARMRCAPEGTSSGRDELGEVIRAAFSRGSGGAMRVRLEPIKEWCAAEPPGGAFESPMIESIARNVVQIENLRRYREVRWSAQLEEAAVRREAEANSLARWLIPLPIGVACISEIARITDARRRMAEMATQPYQSEPAWLVSRLESFSAGCDWLIEHLGYFRRNIEVVRWFAADSFVLLLLMGRGPMDALEDAETALVVLACHTIDRERKNLFVQLRNVLCPEDFAKLRDWMMTNERATLGRLDEEDAKRSLIAVVDRAMARLEAKAAEHRVRETDSAAQRAAVAAYEVSEEGKWLKRRERLDIQILRARLNGLRKHRKLVRELGYQRESELR